jgi:hypothetical protein
MRLSGAAFVFHASFSRPVDALPGAVAARSMARDRSISLLVWNISGTSHRYAEPAVGAAIRSES